MPVGSQTGHPLSNAGAFDSDALWESAIREYSYMNFPAREILEWLLPQAADARRIVLLDDTHGETVNVLLHTREFRNLPVIGIWAREGSSLPAEAPWPVFRTLEEVVAAGPDLLIPFVRRDITGQDPPDLRTAAIRTGARVIPNVLFSHPLARSMTIRYAPKRGPGLLDPKLPPVHRQGFARHVHRYFLAAHFAAGKRVLDCASGCGYGTHILSRVAENAVGVDLNPDVIGYAGRYNAAPNVRYLCEDLTSLPGRFKVDLLTSIETFEHIPAGDLPRFIAAMRDLLEPGGKLVCTTPLAAHTIRNPANPEHVAEYSAEEFISRLGHSFRVDALAFQTFEMDLLWKLPVGYPLPQSQVNTHVVQIAICTRL